MDEKKFEMTDDLLDKVSGGTGAEEEEEEIPTYVDEWAAYEAIYCAGKESYNCFDCGLQIPVSVCICPRCGRREGEQIDPERVEELRRKYPQMPAFQGIQ